MPQTLDFSFHTYVITKIFLQKKLVQQGVNKPIILNHSQKAYDLLLFTFAKRY